MIKFTSKESSEIVITGRTKHYLNLCGEHLSQENMNMAMKNVADELKIEIREFTVAGIKHDKMFAHKWFIGTDFIVDASVIKEKLDKQLKILNDDYRVERIAAINDIIVEVLPTNIFYEWMKSKGKEGAQIKFPRVIKAAQLEDWEKYIKSIMGVKV